MHDSAIQPKILRKTWEQGLQHGLNQVALNMLREGIDVNSNSKTNWITTRKSK